MRALKIFSSYVFVTFMLIVLAIGAATATFIESIYDTQTAKILVYEARWYEIVMLLLTISLSVIIIKTKMWRRFGAFVLHLAFIVIIAGAFLTRYFGYEGVLHVRQGQTQDEMISVKPYLQIRVGDEIFEHYLNMAQIGNNDFSISQNINGENFVIKFNSYVASKNDRNKLSVRAGFESENLQLVELKGGAGWLGEPNLVKQKDKEIMLSWGSKIVKLPFGIKLINFELKHYAGSKSPSSYASYVEVIDGKNVVDYKIFMNNPLTFNGYKFFQSSYDKDELGTILEVNRDLGKIPTYVGYFLLCVGFLANFFTPNSRFLKLTNFIKQAKILLIFAIFFCFDFGLYANDLQNFKQNTKTHVDNEFSTLLVQDNMGRIKPISTEAIDIINKISGVNSLFGLNSTQLILAMSVNPELWQDMKIIKINNKEIKKALNLSDDTRFVSFNFMFDEFGEYKLSKQVDDANAKPVSKRGTFENELIKFDERINVAYLTLKGVFFKFIPIANDTANRWLSPNEAFASDLISPQVKSLLNDYLVGLQEGISLNDWGRADEAIKKIKEYQNLVSAKIVPTQSRVMVENFYNKISIFKNLIYLYIFLGFACLFFAFVCVFTTRRFLILQRAFFALFVVAFVLHTIGLIMRWYISAHAPWSDSYESMIYIGWSAVLAGILFFRNSLFTLGASSILASIVMLVAHMSFVNPQITNLVPVLKSYWLNIHVSVITASYGFLGLGCLLGLVCLVLMSLKNDKNFENINNQIRYISAINEISLIVGLCMLTIGNFFGGIWANESWGRYWGWDSKETWSFVSIIVYAIVLHLRFIPRLNSIYVFCISSVLAYLSIIMTYFGVNFYLTGMHSYASGDTPQVPNFVYLVAFLVFGLFVLSYRGKNVKTI
ncbi:MAG: cytochrome c biogenesis protein CcsA [Campylobacter sp.]